MRVCTLLIITVFIFLSYCGMPVVNAEGIENSDLAAVKKQLESMEKTIKMQQEMINALKDKIESKEVTANQPVAINDEKKIENVVDNYLMKEETREKFKKSGYTPEYFYWDNGMRFKTSDGKFKFKFGGRIMNDWGWFDEDRDLQDSIGDQVDGTEFRRARIYLSGDIYENIGFKVQYDFASGGRPDFKDVYMELKKIPYLGNLRVGHYKEPFSLENLTSSKYIPFMERSLNNVFPPGRNTGFMSYNHALDKRMTWALGIFRNANGWGDSEGDRSTEGGYSFSGRITGLPLYEDDGKKLVHAGFSYSYQNAFENGIRYRSTPELHMADRFVDTGMFAAESVHLFNPELAFVYGPLLLQTEYTFANTDLEDGIRSDPDFSGGYVYGSYFLTGEHRKYSTKKGSFGRVIPNNNFRWGKGFGAIELAARYSHLDLSDEAVNGGRLTDITFGLNWYLNPNMRVMFNYVHADPDLFNAGGNNTDGDADLAAMRFQVDF